MKKLNFLFVLLLLPAISFAQTTTEERTGGLTPQSPFYFLDRLGETVREFLAFNPEARAKIQIKHASERIAEIKIMLESKEVEPRGLEIAEERLRSHLEKASLIVKKEKIKNKDVSRLEEELEEEIEASKDALKASFKAAKEVLEEEKDAIKEELEEAKKSNNTEQIRALKQRLEVIEEEKDALEVRKDEQEKTLEERERASDDLDDEDEDESEDNGKEEDESEEEEGNSGKGGGR